MKTKVLPSKKNESKVTSKLSPEILKFLCVKDWSNYQVLCCCREGCFKTYFDEFYYCGELCGITKKDDMFTFEFGNSDQPRIFCLECLLEMSILERTGLPTCSACMKCETKRLLEEEKKKKKNVKSNNSSLNQEEQNS